MKTVFSNQLIRLLNNNPLLLIIVFGLMIWIIQPYVSAFIKSDNEEKKESVKGILKVIGFWGLVFGAIITLVAYLS